MAIRSSCAQADIPFKLKRAIDQSHILGKQYTCSVSIVEHEATIATYANQETRDLDKDCKINAVLIAKVARTIDPDLSKVKVRFYSFDRKSFRLVSITAGEIVSFNAGQVTQTALLESLDVVEQKATGDAAANTNPADHGTVASRDTEVSYILKKDFAVVSVPGISFNCPRDWQLAKTSDKNAIFKLACKTAGKSGELTLKFLHGEVGAEVAKQQKEIAHDGNKHPARPTNVLIGWHNKVPATSQVVGRLKGFKQYDSRYITIGATNGRVFRLRMETPASDYAGSMRDFQYMLQTLSLH